ncbi:MULTISPECIES: flagellar hook-associated protein 2 [Bacillus]|uniref:flagellar hook-associated protein 2 n=1 Tax=Bacillus TaxID=1386 RepID=UPI000BF5EBA4|nr:flagellar hook-associated protein 2 [Bacillus wiedmannii]MBJ8114943.1 flagellar hook-associated protein 2 [Bacillus cereus]PFW83958.1 flagellar filament capping protein FliD [Bacillus sp. AFS075960]RFB13902.1 flagellar hook-associated protein 2 [Bacillus sp. OE]RFB27278.1 flagellar hook-associated protein 2 [Bacillus sp. LB(2018)]RFB72684.1 flagellar hook-associated protein 2 [Bacillus sp. AW]HDR8170642.1 flagellar hook-associated protein 2 [Bacillus thuringiensis]
MAGTLTGIGGRQQIWNLGNNMIDTSNFVELEMQALEMRKTPYANEKNQLSQDKLLYTSLKSEFSSFTQTFKNLAAFKGNEKKVTTSQDGYINVKADGGAIAGTFNMTITQLAQRHQIASNEIKDINAKLPKDETVKLGDKELKVTTDMTYKDLINKINDGDYGVSAYTLGNKIFMTSKKEGATNEIKLEKTPPNVLTELFYSKVESTTEMKLNTINEALDAKYTINGIDGTSPSNTIETLPGVKIELLKVTEPKVEGTPDAGTTTEPKAKGIDLKFTVSDSNVTDASNIIKKMVADYNKAVSTVDIFAGKGGAFQGQAVMQSVRQAMNNVVTFSQEGNYLFTFGIQLKQDGTMEVNDEALTKALKEKPDAAKQFFFSSNGLGKMMEEPLDKLFGDKGVVGERVKNIDSRVSDLDKKIKDIETQNLQKQDEIVKKYQKLESTLAELDSQLKTIKAMTKQKSDD